MAKFYRRQFELFVSDKENPFIEATNDRQFRIIFNVSQDWGGFNTYADIAIFNLSRESAKEAFLKDEYIALRAGYEDSMDYIFKGQIVNIIKDKQGPDTITRLICKSLGVRLRKSTVNKSYEAGVSIPDLCRACADSLGLPIVINDEDFTSVSPYLFGYHLVGDPKVKLNQLAKSHEFNWLVDKEKIVVVGKKSFRKGAVTLVSASTGMVGVPEETEIGTDVVVRMNPSINIGGRFDIKAEFVQVNYSDVRFQDLPDTLGQGSYVVQKLEYTGDSFGDVWDTRITGLRA